MVDAYLACWPMSSLFPLRLRVTEAGPPPAGVLKATAGIAALLNERHRRHHPVHAGGPY